MNLLSVGAAYGLIVLVFQHGVGADLLGFQQSDQIAAFLPIFLFAVLFGLSMDYHVFLLSRIQERFVKTHDNRGSVSYGLRSTAHIITGAAAIMMAVFSGFALGDMVELQQTGFGLAVAVFLDATIVRSVLVPASMEMLGEWNWYLPSWLRWLPRINVEGGQTAQAPAYQPYAPEYVGAGE
jgi:RND superfamily putative drug exporter